MPVRPADACRLCPTGKPDLIDPAIECFGHPPASAIEAATTSAASSTFVADVLNKHFGFKLHRDRDAATFVCQPCWLHVQSFHSFYQSVLELYNDDDGPLDAWLTKDVKDESIKQVICQPDHQQFVGIGGGGGDPIASANSATKRKAGRPRRHAAASPQIEDAGGGWQQANNDTSDDDSDDEPLDVKPIVKPFVKAEPTTTQASEAASSSPVVAASATAAAEPDSDDAADSGRPAVQFFNCPECGKRYQRAGRLATHRRTAHGATDEAAAAAGNKRPAPESKDSDAKRQQKEDEEQLMQRHLPMECQDCGLKFRKFSEAGRHKRRQNCGLGWIVCCDRKLSEKARAVEHCRWHENPRQFDCLICGLNLATRLTMAAHLARMHPTTEAEHCCSKCPRRYHQINQLRLHEQRIHTPMSERRFECFQCHRRYTQRAELRAHMRTHDPHPMYVCEVCAKQFRTKESYEAHSASHAGGAVKQQCQHCLRWLANDRQLKMHISALHRPGQVAPPPCVDCGHQSPNERALYAHRNKVHKEPRHVCLVCGRKFRVLQGLREHMAMHAGITDLYRCQYCPKTFRSDSNMHKHRKQTHGEEYAADRRRMAAEAEERNRLRLISVAAERAAEREAKLNAAWRQNV